jgi:hypothetical protein
MTMLTRTATVLLIFPYANSVLAQATPVLPNRPWHADGMQQIQNDAKESRESRFSIERLNGNHAAADVHTDRGRNDRMIAPLVGITLPTVAPIPQ